MDCPAMIRPAVALAAALATFAASATEPVIVPRATAGTFDRVVWQGPDGFARQIGRTDRLYFEPFESGAGAKARSTTTAVTVAGDLNLHRYRNITAQSLAVAGRVASKALGPLAVVSLGVELANIYFDEQSEQWVTEELQDPDLSTLTGWRQFSYSGEACYTAAEGCTLEQSKAAVEAGMAPSWNLDWVSCESIDNGTYIQHRCSVERYLLGGPYYDTVNVSLRLDQPMPPQTLVTVPASDQLIEQEILDELINRGFGPELAVRLFEAGYEPSMNPLEVDGPTSLIGPTETSTTTGPAGTTTTTKQTNYDLGYSGDTVTVTPTTTTTTTDPSGTTTTTTSTSGGGSSEVPPEPLGLCDEYPNISACQELGETQDEDLQEEERDLDFEYSDVAGSCPPPQVISTSFGSFSIPFDAFCTYAIGMRPIVILSFLLSAGLFLFYIVRRA